VNAQHGPRQPHVPVGIAAIQRKSAAAAVRGGQGNETKREATCR
jgi:hypothetical protein